MKTRTRRLTVVLSLLVATIGLDQLTKAAARESLPALEPIRLLGDTIRLQHSENPGAFLSLGADLTPSQRFWVFTIGTAVLLGGALWALLRNPKLDSKSTVSLTLLVAGGVGNLIDRATRGTVTDFLNVGVSELRTGIFNVADIAIMVGVGVLIALSFVPEKPVKEKA